VVKIPVIRFQQADRTLYVGKMSASDLYTIGVIDSWDPAKGWDVEVQGYQRKSYEDHYKGIGRFLSDNPDALLPTSILLSARTRERGVLQFEPAGDDSDHTFGYLVVPDGRLLYVVDGQHRMLGFDDAIRERGQAGLKDYLLPVVVLGDADKVEELCQFHLINDRQRRIATSLALALLGTVVHDQPSIAKMLVGPRSMWKMRAISVTIALNEDRDVRNVWVNRIGLPNEPRGTTYAVSLAAFVKSLGPFFAKGYPHKLTNAELGDYLVRFWAALRAILPRPFQSPKEYVIQKTTGVGSLNRVAAELARQRKDVLTATSDGIEPYLRANEERMKDSVWVSRGPLAQEFRGDARFRDLADEILEGMGLTPSRPKKPPGQLNLL